MDRVMVKPELLRWARERARRSIVSLSKRFPKLELWEQGEMSPTLKQLEGFAKATSTPVGFFFLQEPPVESVPIPDFRTVADDRVLHPSPDLLDTVYNCQQRQEWYHDFARSVGEEPREFVGSVNLTNEIEATASSMRHALGFDIAERCRTPTWTDALRRFIEHADMLGVLVMVSGVVGSNNRRKLDPQEFRGFALVDDLAPLVFINGADSKAAQMFTLAHELAHVWLGESALSDVSLLSAPSHDVEVWCNQVAAELLVPLDALKDEYQSELDLNAEVNRLARYFKVSTLVILRRIHDAGGLTQEELWRAYSEELERIMALPKQSGGSFYLTLPARVSKRFARALVISTLEGHTLHRDAFRMLGFSKLATFTELGHRLGVL
ncbi:MAG: ImmA/IrrE family metallo-endopeptidase [Candidatus Hatepunaea meridiana]|nr:ImmA/IrrE family metallo-endopeptidase [Candidatus Hatepunaea meridiana]